MNKTTAKTSNTKQSPEGIYVNGIYHEKEILLSDIVRPSLLTVDHSSNVLYFSILHKDEEDLPHRPARLDLNTKEFKVIDVDGGYALTVDQKTGDVFIGGDDGLYKYDPSSNIVEFIGEKGKNILTIYHKDILYFTTVDCRFLYTFTNGRSTKFQDIQNLEVENLIIDCNDDMFFINDDGLYCQKKGMSNAILYAGLKDSSPLSLTADANGTIHVCYREGVFKVNKATASLIKVLDLDQAFGATFDSENNIIYADLRTIVRLKPKIN
ncbi:ommochrome-binding protein-like [Aphomia sociella]